MTIHVLVTGYVPDGGDATHPRAKYAIAAIRSLFKHLKSSERIQLLYANDGPITQPHCAEIIRIVHAETTWAISISTGPRQGIGGSLNRAMAYVETDDLWMYTTDDWVLTEDYDLSKAAWLVRNRNYDYVRLGPPHPNIHAIIRFEQGLGFWLQLQPQHGGYTFATRPFVASRAFYTEVGLFRADCDAYVCERDYSDRVAELEGSLRLGEVVHSTLEGPWEHIGELEVGNSYP